ncbi:unnamed protein product [Vicia faba]|uniref:Uncharacterized protein n=1 Tax=Vicia faba TaxID=3906 RepID=A0AAV0ZPJ0_VICFA|nr:unnamed protein product [Vicia faba]
MVSTQIGDLEDFFRVVEKCLCGTCMSIHAMSQECQHPDGLVRVTRGTGEARIHIMGIIKPPTIDLDNLKTNQELVFNARFLERVLFAPIFTVNSIPLRSHLAFLQTLKYSLYMGFQI